MSEKDDEKMAATPEPIEDKEKYPQAFNLALIIVALILSMFLVCMRHQLYSKRLTNDLSGVPRHGKHNP